MNNKHLAGFTGLFAAVAVALALICTSCTSPVSVPISDTAIVTVKASTNPGFYTANISLSMAQCFYVVNISDSGFGQVLVDSMLTQNSTFTFYSNDRIQIGWFHHFCTCSVQPDTTYKNIEFFIKSDTTIY